MTKFGLPQRTMNELHAIFKKYPQVEKVIIYGSRALGKERTGSDIDLTLLGSSLNWQDLEHVSGAIDDSDLSIFNQIDHPDLKDHIHRVGQLFYERMDQSK
jgi:predicted nucleotidyltransferase